MKQKNIQSIIREICIRKMLYPLLTFIVTVFIFTNVPFYGVWNPVKITSAGQITDFYNGEIYYVDITWETLYYSGYDYLENGKLAGSYYYALEDNICYFVILSPELTENKAEVLNQVHIKAKLVSGGKMLQELIKKMAADLGWTAQGLSAAASHIIMDEADYVLMKSNVLFAINVLLAVIAVFTIGRLLFFMMKPVCYPTCSRMRCYGSVKSHIRQLNKERKEENLVCGDLTVTRHYLVFISRYEIQMLPLKDIVWAYKHSMFHRYRKQKITYTLRVIGKRGITIIAPGQKKEDADNILAFLSKNFPDIKVGYKKEYEQMARKHGWREKTIE